MAAPMNARWKQYFGWSHSRAGVFRDCLKKYCFQYVFKYEDSEPARMAKLLGKLETLPQAKGSLLHEEIERIVKGTAGDPAGSRARLAGSFDALAREAPRRMLEVRFGQLTAEAAARKLAAEKADALAQLDRFLLELWPRYRDLELVSAEVLERFESDGLPIWVAADMVVRDPAGELVVVDWKSGRSEHDAGESEQLTAYFFWAEKRFGAPLERIRAELVWLGSGRVDATRRDRGRVDALRARIAADVAEMTGLTSYEQVKANPSESKCRRCPFLPLCREAGSALPETAKQRVLAELRAELA